MALRVGVVVVVVAVVVDVDIVVVVVSVDNVVVADWSRLRFCTFCM